MCPDGPVAGGIDMPAAAGDGLATLDPESVALREALERRFLGWAADYGARPTIYPALMRVSDLDRLDYFENFPHLALLATGISRETLNAGDGSDAGAGSIRCGHLDDAAYALPSAACFNVYLGLRGQTVQSPWHVTTAANCFRREEGYEGLRRLLGFYMREVVCVGEREHVIDYLGSFQARVESFLRSIHLPVEIVPSSDPFFDARSSKAVMAQLFPVKNEVVYGGDLAIASLNFHRNFFGERCDIKLPDGEHAHSGCVAFGIERWIAALTSHFGDDPTALRARIERDVPT